MHGIDDTILGRIEKMYPTGLTSAEIVDLFARHGVPLSAATLRKYVQLGLLPRSVRVGKKGKHQGSQGLYPVRVVRQILDIKRMMAQSFTIEQIQRQFMFVRGELEQLEQTLRRVFEKLDQALHRRRRGPHRSALSREVNEARAMGQQLLSRLRAIEVRLGLETGLEDAAAVG